MEMRETTAMTMVKPKRIFDLADRRKRTAHQVAGSMDGDDAGLWPPIPTGWCSRWAGGTGLRGEALPRPVPGWPRSRPGCPPLSAVLGWPPTADCRSRAGPRSRAWPL